jgi:predicted nucleic acid-binding protein
VSKFVLDASVVLAWCFPDENADLAQYVADMFRRGNTALAPAFWPHEVLNALLVGEKRKRISKELVQRFLDDLAALPVELKQFPAGMVFDRIQSLARKYGLTAHDAAYLDLALESGVPVASMDEDLVRACRRAGAELLRP